MGPSSGLDMLRHGFRPGTRQLTCLIAHLYLSILLLAFAPTASHFARKMKHDCKAKARPAPQPINEAYRVENFD